MVIARCAMLALIVLVCWLAGDDVFPQGTQLSDPVTVNGNNNEATKANLDWIAQSAGEQKLIIVIARLGGKESVRSLNRKRLQTIRSYLQNIRGISKERIVTAEGESVGDVGRVEVYLDGHLFMVLSLARNRNFAPKG